MNKIETIQKEAYDIYNQRNKIYKDAYKNSSGKIKKIFFPDGITLETEKDFNRWSLFNHIISDLCRYAMTFKEGGHRDSLIDAINYASMLIEIDDVEEKTTDELVSESIRSYNQGKEWPRRV